MEPDVCVADVSIWMVHLIDTAMTEKPAEEDLVTTLAVTWAKVMADMTVDRVTRVNIWLLQVLGSSWAVKIVRVLRCDVPIHSIQPTAKGVVDEGVAQNTAVKQRPV